MNTLVLLALVLSATVSMMWLSVTVGTFIHVQRVRRQERERRNKEAEWRRMDEARIARAWQEEVPNG